MRCVLQIEERVMDRMAATAMIILIINLLGRYKGGKTNKTLFQR